VTISRVARGTVPVLALIATYFALHGGDTLVPLLLMGYNFVTHSARVVLSLGGTRRDQGGRHRRHPRRRALIAYLGSRDDARQAAAGVAVGESPISTSGSWR